MAKKGKKSTIDFPFYEYLRSFIGQERKKIYNSFTPLTRKFLSFNNPITNQARAFLRLPQFEALETYVFLKEFCGNKKLCDIFHSWYYKTDEFEGRQYAGMKDGMMTLFSVNENNAEADKQTFNAVYEQIEKLRQDYPNYIFALTMGLGKTILMATTIFYEFLLANKYPKDSRFCHNVLIFAPDKTVLQSLKEILTFDKSKVVPTEYISWLESNIKFHFLSENGDSLNTIDNSNYNIIISNTQKIILKKTHTGQNVVQTLFGESTGKYTILSKWNDLAKGAGMATDDDISKEMDLNANHRFQTLLKLNQLGVFVDEAHHLFGNKLADDLTSFDKTTSLRFTINEIAAQLKARNSAVVACINFTGTPYVKKKLLPEVVYSYGLKAAIDNKYLKHPSIKSYSHIKDNTLVFCKTVIEEFWKTLGEKRFEGMLPKIAFYASSIEELKVTLLPAVTEVLTELNIPINKILVNVGDTSITNNDDLREFNNLDKPNSNKQFILLVNKGKEGWNCRSLFAVALHRKPDSTVFVLQATMRCLRQITDVQQTGYVYLSEENREILDNELQENFHLSVDDMNNSGTKEKVVEVRIMPPSVKLEIKRTHKMFNCVEKTLKEKIKFETDRIQWDNYTIEATKRSINDLSQKISVTLIDDSFSNIQYSEFTLIAEIARYIHYSPITIGNILRESDEGIMEILNTVNRNNKLLYDYIIPKLFGYLFDIIEYEKNDPIVVELVKEPKDGEDCYVVHYKEDLHVSKDDAQYKPFTDKTFNVDNYCFDSKPEKAMFWTLLHDKRLEKVWFTGMFTKGQSDFYINYIDPVSGSVRSYFPDFVTMDINGNYCIIEVKGDNMMDDPVVLAKKQFAQQMAKASNMQYYIISGTDAMKGCNVG